MPPHIDLGKRGEQLAAEWLVGKGYAILHRNWRSGRQEVDLIARKESTLHFIEIKCRRSNAFGPPEESVSRAKLRNMMRAALAWRIRFPGPGRVQYDVLSITVQPNAEPAFFFIEDVYL